MKLKRRSVTKLASLSAFGAGAVVVGLPEADATIITASVNQKVGFDGVGAGDTTRWTSGLLGASGARLSFFTAVSGSTNRIVKASRTGGSVYWAGVGSKLQIFSAGQTWASRSNNVNGLASVAKRHFHTFTTKQFTGPTCPTNCTISHIYTHTSHSTGGNSAFTNKYALFTFTDGGNTDYGWVKLSLSLTDAAGTGNGLGPELNIISYAYDDSGAVIQAGDTGPVPEPGTLTMTGLAALALGAAGLRRWRAERVKSQAPVSA